MERPADNEPKSMGAILRAYRERAGLSQAELGRRTGVERLHISSMELGRIQVIYPDKFNPLHDALGFAGFEVLEAMGYQTDAGIGNINPQLFSLIQRLTPAQQIAAIHFIRAGLEFLATHPSS